MATGRATSGDEWLTPGAKGGGNGGSPTPTTNATGGNEYKTPAAPGGGNSTSPTFGGGHPTTPTNANASVDSSVDAWANSLGLGALSPWINQQIHTLAGQGMSAGDTSTTISDTINKAPGFDALMPGYNQRLTNGYSNTDSGAGAGIAGYISYRQQLNAMAETAGLVPGTLSAQDIGNGWANDVSTNEMSTRITQEYTSAAAMMNSPQGQTMLNELKNYGYTQSLTAGQLLSYYINPANTTNTLQQQLNSAVVGGEGQLTGFGEIGQAKANALQAFLSNNGQNNLTAAQGANFFNASAGSGLNSIAGMANAGFEQAQLGTAQNGPGVVTQDQLLAAGEGNASALQTVQRAAQTRAASGSGGGGLAAGQGGVSGVGFGSQ